MTDKTSSHSKDTPTACARRKFLESSLASTRKSYYPQLKQQLAVARELAEKYRQLVASAPAGIFELALSPLRFTSVNDVMCTFTGYSRKQLLSMDPLELLTHRGRETFDQVLDQARSGIDHPAPVECEVCTRKGRIFWVLINSKFFCENNAPVRTTTVIHDLTALHQAQEEKKQLESQLSQARKMESIGTLAGGIAHDFNNILGVILGHAEIMLQEPADKSAGDSESLKEIRGACLRAKEVIRGLMSFARKSEPEKVPTRLDHVINEAVKMLRSSLPPEVEIRVCSKEILSPVLADQTQINQILLNICINAQQAMPDGGILDIELNNRVVKETDTDPPEGIGPGDYVILSITDTGTGIPDEIIDRIFDPYFTTKPLGQGTGMGLAVVHGILKNHNAAVQVKSRSGHGTCFKIFFPATAREAGKACRSNGDIPHGRERILLVDDDQAILEMTRIMLTRLGYEVLAVNTPQAALDHCREKPVPFDLVLTDLAMPRMDGVTLSGHVKVLCPDLPIILCSGDPTRLDDAVTGDVGIRAAITKPVLMEELARTIREVLDETGNTSG